MPLPSFSCTLKVSGAAVPVTAEACSSISGANPNKLYQVTNTARRIWDPSVAPIVKDGGVTVSALLYTFDFLFGFIQFAGYTQTGAITVDGSYLPVASIAEVTEFSFNGKADLLDRTSYDSAGARQKVLGLVDSSGSLKMLSQLWDDLDPVTGGSQTMFAVFTSKTPKLLEFKVGTYYLRWWVLLEGLSVSAAVAGLVETSATLAGSPQFAPGAVFSFGQ
jgi:hypothetical protein